MPFRQRFTFAERKIEPEVLDHSPPDLAQRNLADLVRINRHFGGHATILKLLAGANLPGCEFTVLDVGAASGDTARVIRHAYAKVRVYNLDLHPVNLSAADHPKVIGDAFQLPFATGSIDYVMCSLFLHHFQDDQVVQLLGEFHRVSSRGVLIADLERSLWPYLFIGYSGPLFGWGKITVDDGKKSVRAGFRKTELEALAKQAGLVGAQVEEHRPAFRLTLVATK
jgi:ubiquinone/menaquinone biosynthesis C-methylase UbiE